MDWGQRDLVPFLRAKRKSAHPGTQILSQTSKGGLGNSRGTPDSGITLIVEHSCMGCSILFYSIYLFPLPLNTQEYV